MGELLPWLSFLAPFIILSLGVIYWAGGQRRGQQALADSMAGLKGSLDSYIDANNERIKSLEQWRADSAKEEIAALRHTIELAALAATAAATAAAPAAAITKVQ